MPSFVTESVRVTGANVAVTDLAASIVTTQAPVPVQAPDQPVNVELAPGVAVSVTTRAVVVALGAVRAAVDPGR